LDENLRKPAQVIGIKLLDKIFVKESEEPMAAKLHKEGTPVVEMGIFMAVFAYLFGFYSLVRHLYNNGTGPKVKPY